MGAHEVCTLGKKMEYLQRNIKEHEILPKPAADAPIFAGGIRPTVLSGIAASTKGAVSTEYLE